MAEDFVFDYCRPGLGLSGEPLKKISREYIKSWLSRESDIRTKVKALIMRELNTIEVSGRNLVVADVIVRYVIMTLRRDLEMLVSAGRDSFEMLGQEIRVKGSFCGQKFKE